VCSSDLTTATSAAASPTTTAAEPAAPSTPAAPLPTIDPNNPPAVMTATFGFTPPAGWTDISASQSPGSQPSGSPTQVVVVYGDASATDFIDNVNVTQQAKSPLTARTLAQASVAALQALGATSVQVSDGPAIGGRDSAILTSVMTYDSAFDPSIENPFTCRLYQYIVKSSDTTVYVIFFTFLESHPVETDSPAIATVLDSWRWIS
jgi:hypothetical protein